MQIAPHTVADSYLAQRQHLAPRPDAASGTLITGVESFGDTLRASENAALQVLHGQGDPHLFVQSLAQTELAVETAVTIRNKVVEAYQEILRMPV